MQNSFNHNILIFSQQGIAFRNQVRVSSLREKSLQKQLESQARIQESADELEETQRYGSNNNNSQRLLNDISVFLTRNQSNISKDMSRKLMLAVHPDNKEKEQEKALRQLLLEDVDQSKRSNQYVLSKVEDYSHKILKNPRPQQESGALSKSVIYGKSPQKNERSQYINFSYDNSSIQSFRNRSISPNPNNYYEFNNTNNNNNNTNLNNLNSSNNITVLQQQQQQHSNKKQSQVSFMEEELPNYHHNPYSPEKDAAGQQGINQKQTVQRTDRSYSHSNPSQNQEQQLNQSSSQSNNNNNNSNNQSYQVNPYHKRSYSNYTSSITNINNNNNSSFTCDENILSKKYSFIISAENKIQKMIQRYDNYDSQYQKIQRKVQTKRDQLQNSLEGSIAESPDIRKQIENKDLLEVLMRQTNYEKRKQERVKLKQENRYGKQWKNLYLPKIPTRFQNVESSNLSPLPSKTMSVNDSKNINLSKQLVHQQSLPQKNPSNNLYKKIISQIQTKS